MAQVVRFLTTLRTSPRRAILLELAFIALGAALLGLAFLALG